MSSEKWFRQSNWTEEIERQFFLKLARSRSQRDQYLAIQAITLANVKPDAALRLVDIYFETKTSNVNDVRALDARAQANRALGKIPETVSAMKEILQTEREHPGFKTNCFTDFPYFIAENRLSSEYDSAIKVLIEREGDLKFPISHFKWHAAMSIINAERENPALAKVHANLAIDAASMTDSGMRYHSSLGIVDERFKEVVAQLRQIAHPN